GIDDHDRQAELLVNVRSHFDDLGLHAGLRARGPLARVIGVGEVVDHFVPGRDRAAGAGRRLDRIGPRSGQLAVGENVMDRPRGVRSEPDLHLIGFAGVAGHAYAGGPRVGFDPRLDLRGPSGVAALGPDADRVLVPQGVRE